MVACSDKQCNTKKISSLDITKFIMAIFVIAIHTTNLQSSDNIIIQSIFKTITDLAVPFFFMTSAYLLFKKIDTCATDNECFAVLKKFLFRIVRLYIIWSIIYLPLAIYEYVKSDTGIVYSVVSYIKQLLLVGEHYYSWPLWYLLSTIYALIIMMLIKKLRMKVQIIFFISIFVFLFGQTITYVMDFHLLPDFFDKTINYTINNGRLISGISYFITGAALAMLPYRIDKRKAFALFVLIMLIMIVFYEQYIIYYLLKLLLSFMLFEFIIQIDIEYKPMYSGLRFASAVMYFTHMYFFFVYSKLHNLNAAYGTIGFLFTLFMTLLLSVWLKTIKDNKLIKQLFH